MTAFPVTRLRRLRRTDTLRALVRETRLSLDDVVMPLFACPGEGVVRPVAGLEAIAQRSVDELVREATELESLGATTPAPASTWLAAVRTSSSSVSSFSTSPARSTPQWP